MSERATHDLIEALASDAAPVRRLFPPAFRAVGWIVVVLVAAAVLARFSDLAALRARLMGVPDLGLAELGAASTALLAAFAAFETSVPGRSRAWAWLPVPALLLWIGASGFGCLRSWAPAGLGQIPLGETRHCAGFILCLSAPLSALLFVMLRRAAPLRPGLTAMLGGLAAAAASATLLNFIHPYDASATDLVVHGSAVAVVTGANRVLGGRLLGP